MNDAQYRKWYLTRNAKLTRLINEDRDSLARLYDRLADEQAALDKLITEFHAARDHYHAVKDDPEQERKASCAMSGPWYRMRSAQERVARFERSRDTILARIADWEQQVVNNGVGLSLHS